MVHFIYQMDDNADLTASASTFSKRSPAKPIPLFGGEVETSVKPGQDPVRIAWQTAWVCRTDNMPRESRCLKLSAKLL
jgi:hypothetical protein